MPSPRNSTVTVRAPSSPNDYRQRIINLVAMHEPSKLGTLNVALSHFQGREEKLLSTLSTRLGSEPTPQEVTELAEHMKSFPPTSPRAKDSTTPRVSPTSPRAKLLQTRVVNLYRKYQPDRLKEIKSILAAIAGREEQALQMLVKKYGPEPTQEEISAMPPVTPRLNATTPQSRFASPRVSVTSTSTPHTTIQQRIKNILLKYDREKVDQINFESEKIRGHEEQILNTLVQKYGPEPTLAEVVVLEQQAKDNSSSEYQMYRTRVSSMLRRYNPSKLGTEDTILSMYRGKEEELLRSMIAKYGPEPSAESNATPAPSAPSTPGPKSSWQSTSALKSPRSRPLSPQVDSVNFSQLVVTVPHGLESNNNSRITSPQDLPICTNIFSNADQHPNFRARVGNMYIKYAPQKLTDLSHDVLKHIGREEVHMKELVAQYGPEPSEAEILGIISAPGNYQNRILRMYQTYNAHKMEEAKDLVVSNCGREAELMHSLILSFGPEPSDSTLSTSVYKENPATPLPFTIEELENQSSGSNEHRALDFRTRITNIYLRYCPLKLGTVDEMVQRTPRGAEEALILELVRKYGPEPHEAEIKNLKAIPGNTSQLYQGVMPLSPARRKNYRSILYNYCIVHEPKNIPRIDETLAQFIGQEDVLMRNLFIKYGPEPSADEVAKAKNACSSTSVQDLSKYRERLVRFYKKYDPSMESSIDEVMHKYLGREDELMMTLLARYGPEPVEITQPVQDYPSEKAPASIVVHGPDIKTRVMHMFMRYDPERLPCVESIMGQYVGKEDEIIKHLVNVYGPEPSVGDVAWHVFLAANDRDKSESKSSLGNGSAKTVEDKMDLRTCMNNFCVRYDPDLIALMDDMFSRYAKQFEERVQSLFGSVSTQCSKTSSVEKVVQSYYPRLRNFFIKYAPGRVGTEDEVLKAHEGFEEEMMISFTRLYGPEPTGGEIGMMKTYYKPLFRKRVIALLSKYDPNQLESVDTLLATFDGAEDELLRHLVVKYGPEPTEQERLAELAQQRMAASMSLSGMELDTRARVINILSKYAPSRLAEVDGMVEVFKGKEEDLFRELTAMYRIEPTKEEALSKKCATAMRGPTPGSSRTDSQMSTTPCRSLDSPAPQPDLPSSLQRPTTISETRCNSNVVSAANMNRASLVHVPAPGPSASTSFAPKQVVSTGAEQVFTRPPPNMPQQPPTPTAPQLQMDYRTRVCNFFTKYDPGNLPLLDEILEAYEGEEEHLLREMFLRYGPEPSNVEVAEVLRVAWVMYYREKLSELYSAHDPERLKCIDEDLEKYAGHEAELLESLTFLYSDIEMRKKASESHAL